MTTVRYATENFVTGSVLPSLNVASLSASSIEGVLSGSGSNQIVEASNYDQEVAAFAAGAVIVIRTDLL